MPHGIPIHTGMTPETAGIDHLRDTATSGHTYLSARDLAVLRMLADGCDTIEIAQRLVYSESLIKRVVQRLTAQFNARNRTHLVAIAIRAGLI